MRCSIASESWLPDLLWVLPCVHLLTWILYQIPTVCSALCNEHKTLRRIFQNLACRWVGDRCQGRVWRTLVLAQLVWPLYSGIICWSTFYSSNMRLQKIHTSPERLPSSCIRSICFNLLGSRQGELCLKFRQLLSNAGRAAQGAGSHSRRSLGPQESLLQTSLSYFDLLSQLTRVTPTDHFEKKNQLTHLECFTLRPRIGITGENQLNTHRGIKIFLSQINLQRAEHLSPALSASSCCFFLCSSWHFLRSSPVAADSLLGHLQLEPLPFSPPPPLLSFFLTSLFPQAEKTHKQVRRWRNTAVSLQDKLCLWWRVCRL